MSINPAWSLLKSAGDIVRPGEMPPKKGSIPTWLILMGISLLPELFKERKDPYEEALKLKTYMKMLGIEQPYQSRFAKIIDPVVAQALLAQLGRTSNWGWPSGMGIDTSFIQKALSGLRSAGLSRVRRRQTGGILGG